MNLRAWRKCEVLQNMVFWARHHHCTLEFLDLQLPEQDLHNIWPITKDGKFCPLKKKFHLVKRGDIQSLFTYLHVVYFQRYPSINYLKFQSVVPLPQLKQLWFSMISSLSETWYHSLLLSIIIVYLPVSWKLTWQWTSICLLK